MSKRIVLGAATIGPEKWAVPLEEYEFTVNRSWKGVGESEVRLRQGYSNCDSTFLGGETYLVFASPNFEDSSAYSSGKCGPTATIENATRQLVDLGRPSSTHIVTSASIQSLGNRYFARLYFIAGLAAQLNVVRHARDPDAWRAAGIRGLALVAGALLSALASVATLVRRRRTLAGALLLVSMSLAVASVFASGASLLSSGFYTHYKEWRQ